MDRITQSLVGNSRRYTCRRQTMADRQAAADRAGYRRGVFDAALIALAVASIVILAVTV